MTLPASRFNIKPMFKGITEIVVVLFGLFGTVMASQSRWMRQFASPNGIVYGVLSLYFFGMFKSVLFFVSVVIFFLFFGLFVRYSAFYTMAIMAIFPGAVFVKFRNWFNLPAFRTSLFGFHKTNYIPKLNSVNRKNIFLSIGNRGVPKRDLRSAWSISER